MGSMDIKALCTANSNVGAAKAGDCVKYVREGWQKEIKTFCSKDKANNPNCADQYKDVSKAAILPPFLVQSFVSKSIEEYAGKLKSGTDQPIAESPQQQCAKIWDNDSAWLQDCQEKIKKDLIFATCVHYYSSLDPNKVYRSPLLIEECVDQALEDPTYLVCITKKADKHCR